MSNKQEHKRKEVPLSNSIVTIFTVTENLELPKYASVSSLSCHSPPSLLCHGFKYLSKSS